MALILNIETSTKVCSVTLAKDGNVLSLRESYEDKSHATLLTVFIDEILKEQNVSAQALDAVAVSKGPGSYTGLRIGVSTAKGIAYGIGKPLIAVNTLQAMTKGLFESKVSAVEGADLFLPMIDARRMEVYTGVWDKTEKQIQEITSKVIDEDAFSNHSEKLLLFGNGAQKCKEVLNQENVLFFDDYVISASHMVTLSEQKFKDKKFEDVAYFEPFYLKEFMATTPKNNVLGNLLNKS